MLGADSFVCASNKQSQIRGGYEVMFPNVKEALMRPLANVSLLTSGGLIGVRR